MPGSKPYCPVGPLAEPAYSLAALDPLLSELRTGRPKAGSYPVGTFYADGRLDLCKQAIGVRGCGRLAENMRDCLGVSSLLLGTNGLGDDGAEPLSQLIQGNPHLDTLYLGCNHLSARGVGSLTQGLARVSFRGALWLKRNPLGEEGCAALALAFRRGCRPRVLDLEQCGVEASGLRLLVDAILESGHGLQRLCLAGNGLGPECLPDLLRLLTLPGLRTLQLRANHLADLTGCWPACSLEKLGLASNGLGDGHLLALLERGPQLLELDLGRTRADRVLKPSANEFGSQALGRFLEGWWPQLQRLSLSPAHLRLPACHSLPPTLQRLPVPPQIISKANPPSASDPDLLAVRSGYR